MTVPRVVRRGRAVLPPPALRPAEPADLAACTHVWRDSLSDYLLRLNQPEVLTDLEPVQRLLAHLLATDPGAFWVAAREPAVRPDDRVATSGARDERIVGFASANVRGTSWFLAMLFVEPSEQGRGVGTELLDRTLPGGRRPPSEGWTFGTATDSVQPISNAIYARLGLVPRVPMLHLAGDVRHERAFPRLPDGTRADRYDADAPPDAATIDAIAGIDRAVLGYEHPEDHAYLRRENRVAILYRDRDGRPLGYGYTSRVGRVGPVAALDPELLPALVGHLLGAVRPTGAFSTWVPGAAGSTVAGLLEAGLRLEPFPALHCWDRPSVDDSRYIPITLALL